MKTSILRNWNSYLERFEPKDRDVYFDEEYVKLYEAGKAQAECFLYEEGERLYLLPYLKKRIGALNEECYDIESAYGYSGPIANNDDSDFINRAFDSFFNLAGENKIVAGFIRFHPLLDNYRLVNGKCEVIMQRNTVAINLLPAQEQIWQGQFSSAMRTAIRKAQKHSLDFIIDKDWRALDLFCVLYRQTMESKGADSFYYFDKPYFERIKDALGEKAVLALVYLKDKLISAGIFFICGIYGHYHLGTSLKEYLDCRPNNFLFYKTAFYLKDKGARVFHLGGGTDNLADNALYRFKRNFSPYEYKFYAGKLIIDRGKYCRLIADWEGSFPEKSQQYKNFVLKYRY